MSAAGPDDAPGASDFEVALGLASWLADDLLAGWSPNNTIAERMLVVGQVINLLRTDGFVFPLVRALGNDALNRSDAILEETGSSPGPVSLLEHRGLNRTMAQWCVEAAQARKT